MGALTDCLACPAGYYCNERGLGDIIFAKDLSANYLCPLGYFCPSGINFQPVPCPEGTYLDAKYLREESETGLAVHLADCQMCPGGYFCGRATADRYQNPCQAGDFCPDVTWTYHEAIGIANGQPTLCPATYYCEGTGDGLYEVEKCPPGFYCPAGSSAPIHCDFDVDYDVCPMILPDCEPGTYLKLNHCLPCPAGHVCDKATNQTYPINEEDHGYVCPPGHYCPAGTSTATLRDCPVGTFRNITKGKDVEDCFKCPYDSF